MCFMKSLNLCQCPYQMEDKMPTLRRSPLDSLGYKAKCCGCVPLKAAVIVIGLVTLIWAALQIESADKIMSDIFPDKSGPLFCYSKICYSCTAAILMLACGILFLGLVVSKYHIINIFVWYGFIFNCLTIALIVTGFVLKIVTLENKIMKHTLKFIISLAWNFLFFYFLVIVNSYKVMTLWT